MEVLLQRAKSFASEAAKRSQDLAKEAAKISQEIAQETAKRSKELATEASKKADQLKALAGDITLPIPSASLAPSSVLPSTSSSVVSDEELIKYGITPELREFVHGLTLSTFQDFPLEEFNSDANDDLGTSNIRQDLTDWQEQHALHVLKAVPEISQFRYELCPRHMKEKRFWKIYFTLVRSHVVLYEAPAVMPEDFLRDEHHAKPTVATSEGIQLAERPSRVVDTSEKKRSIDDQDLDAYLLGDSDGDGEDVGFDAEFDQLVNSSALNSDAEEEQKGDSKIISSSGKKAMYTFLVFGGLKLVG
ncbi:hypothetical protein GOP47_0018029 [Adiantum capillus-veneris]|uniref:BSD domain-containing protein n=1 Tax=Adiantum capillus-veneris TaxID=13818 RepID=A0A9D4UHP6_ADICA|nr:hypothetical protein GOP47_0018029 [Adiantum capillus-veneris]